MPESLLVFAALLSSAFFAGIVNSIAGGGQLLTFPALLAILSPVGANATSTIAVLPGSFASAWAYRQQVQHPPKILLWLIGPSCLGGLCGTWIVTHSPESTFAALIPWLILLAAVLFAVQPLLAAYTKSAGLAAGDVLSPGRLTTLAGVQFLVGLYGGYFGAGIGIMMLSALAYVGLRDVHEMNSVKTVLGGLINTMAAVLFIAGGKVEWKYAIPMALASTLGGYLGARLALRVKPLYVRWTVIALGLSLAAYYFYRH